VCWNLKFLELLLALIGETVYKLVQPLLRLAKRISYGWVVLTTYSIIGTSIFGIRFSFGIFFKSIEGEFGLTRTATSGVFSVYLVLSAVCGVFGGWALDKYGPRAITFLMGFFTGLSLVLTSYTSSAWQLFIVYSLLLAIGTGATYAAMTSTVARWFEEKRGLATGIVASSTGLEDEGFMKELQNHLVKEHLLKPTLDAENDYDRHATARARQHMKKRQEREKSCPLASPRDRT
jgi:MFS family permease